MWNFIGRIAFWRLIRLAAWIGSKAFTDGRYGMEEHGRLSRAYVYGRIWRPRELAAQASATKVDDAFFLFGRGFLRWDVDEQEQMERDRQNRKEPSI